jgi:hypothetical protein
MLSAKRLIFAGLLIEQWLLTGLFLPVSAQEPVRPTLYLVTVDPETGNDIISWIPSPSSNVTYYVVAIVNPLDPFVSVQPIAQVPATDTFYVNPNPESANGPVGYTVYAVNDPGGGPYFPSLWDEPDSTIYLEAVFDSCQATISLSWNAYTHWTGSISEYDIYRRTGPGIYVLLGSVNDGTTTYVLDNLQVNQPYDLFVEAVHQDNIRRSTSNRLLINTVMSQQPAYINADFATLGPGNTIALSFTVDAASALDHYRLMRSTSPNGFFSQIAEIQTTDNTITYNDNVPFRSGIYYYRLDVINNCGVVAAQSNLANNIILNGTINDRMVTLSWNEYLDWEGGVGQYRIIRTHGVENPQVDTLSAGTNTNFSDDVSNLLDYNDPVNSGICYQIEAVEQNNPYGVEGKSLSNQVCFSISPDVRMPNAFIPNDNDPVNQLLEPVFSFLPERYDLIIYNRLGLKVWEGSGPWDGKINGRYVPEGVYLYYLRVYNHSTDILEFNGKVTVVYR